MRPGKDGLVFSPRVYRAMVGVETGILGGLAMLSVLAARALFDFDSVWIVPNLLGSVLGGHLVVHRSFGWTTVSGLGMHLFLSGLIGMAFGLLIGDSRSRLRVVLMGIITGLVWYYFSQVLLWRKLGVTALIYSPPQTLLLAHLSYGLALGWFPGRLGSYRRSALRDAAENESETATSPDAVE